MSHKTTITYLSRDKKVPHPPNKHGKKLPSWSSRIKEFSSHTQAKGWLKDHPLQHFHSKIVDRPAPVDKEA
jgi:hypothetical protein